MNVDLQRWRRLSELLGVVADSDEYARLVAAYGEPHRAYHTLQHLSKCFEKLDWAASNSEIESENTAIVEAALWYHDAIYQPRADDNEQQSAQWAFQSLSKAGLAAEECDRIRSLIMATCHNEQPNEPTQQLVVDIDLSILGAEPIRFEEYERQIRQEYEWVPLVVYKEKRRTLLQYFLAASRIYNTELFYTHFEDQARENLRQSMETLR